MLNKQCIVSKHELVMNDGFMNYLTYNAATIVHDVNKR